MGTGEFQFLFSWSGWKMVKRVVQLNQINVNEGSCTNDDRNGYT